MTDCALMRGAQCLTQRKHPADDSCYLKQLAVKVSFYTRNECRIGLMCLSCFPLDGFESHGVYRLRGWNVLLEEGS